MLRVKRGRFGRKITKRSEPTQEEQDALLARIMHDAEVQSANTPEKTAPYHDTLKVDSDAMKRRLDYDKEIAMRQAQIDRMQKNMDEFWKERGKRKPPPANVYNINKKNKGALSAFMRRGNPKQRFEAIHPYMRYVNREKDGHCFYHSLAYGIEWQTNSTIEQYVNSNYFFSEGSVQQKDLLRKTQDIKNKLMWNSNVGNSWQQRTPGLILRNALENIYINEYRDKPNKLRQIIDGGDLSMRDLQIDTTQKDLDDHLVETYDEPVLTLWPAAVERLEKVNRFYDENGKKNFPDFQIGDPFYMIAGSTGTVGARGVVTGFYKPNEEYERTKARYNHYYVKFERPTLTYTDLSEKFMAHDWEVKETTGDKLVRVHSFSSTFVENTGSWASLGVIPFALNVFRERDEGDLKFCNKLTLYLYSEAGVSTGADLWVRFYWDQRENRYRSCLVEPGEKVEIMCSIFMYFTGNHFDALRPSSTFGTIQLNSLRYNNLDNVYDNTFGKCGFQRMNVITKLKL